VTRLARAALAAFATAAITAPLALCAAPAARAVAAPPASLVITSVSPTFARPGTVVTVSGTVTNTSGATVPGMTVQVLSSATPFSSRSELQAFADGLLFAADYPVPGAVTDIPSLAPHATASWSIRLPVRRVGMTSFGVYPLAAEASSAAGAAPVTDNTFLPFWPGRKAADPRAQDIAWIWPLIDQPRQAACSALLNNGLAASLSGGRLAGLLKAGAAYAQKAHLTWAIDPALLANAQAMTSSYLVGGNAACQGGTLMPASKAARDWLITLRAATAGQPVFVTPYADVDVAALTRASLGGDLRKAYSLGRSVAGQILGRSFNPGAASTRATGRADPAVLNALAWPADGIANYEVLENLAAIAGISTVVLDSSTMPPAPPVLYTPSAQTKTPDGVGPDLHVLLADDTITQLLGSANSPSDSRGTAFAVAQRYLAETAMITAEAPSLSRSIVVAPPRHWNPPAGLAESLLAETVHAPWLHTVSLGQLAAAKSAPGEVTREPPRAVSSAELSRSLLRKVKQLDRGVQVLQSIRKRPDPALYAAVAAVESSAWRGGGAAGRHAQQLLARVSGYVASQESGLTVIGINPVTLGGLKATVPVSIDNRLGYPVRVRLKATSTGGTITVKGLQNIITVPSGEITIHIKLSAARVGSTTVRLSLVTPEGVPIPRVAPVQMTVRATHYGTLALIIIAAALGVFMLTSATRAFRRGRDAQQPPDGHAPTEPSGAGESRDLGGTPDSDSFVTDRASEPGAGGSATAGENEDREDTDEYARAPRRADYR
jgi:Family of unknown function (DUF6049)